MTTVTEIAQHVSTLVETNRALVSDLDITRRVVAEISRERDALREQVERLQSHAPGPRLVDSDEEPRNELELMRGKLAEQMQQVNILRRERDSLLREARDAGARLRSTEDRASALSIELEQVAQDRDDVLVQLDQASSAMDEIREYLQGSVDQMGLCEQPA
jgi:chromosome segregation ATPase